MLSRYDTDYRPEVGEMQAKIRITRQIALRDCERICYRIANEQGGWTEEQRSAVRYAADMIAKMRQQR
jgi:hypothetical protein